MLHKQTLPDRYGRSPTNATTPSPAAVQSTPVPAAVAPPRRASSRIPHRSASPCPSFVAALFAVLLLAGAAAVLLVAPLHPAPQTVEGDSCGGAVTLYGDMPVRACFLGAF